MTVHPDGPYSDVQKLAATLAASRAQATAAIPVTPAGDAYTESADGTVYTRQGKLVRSARPKESTGA